MTELVDIGATRACATTKPTPMFRGFICERDAGHYPDTPHAAFLDDHDRSPVYWNNAGQETDEDSAALEPFKPLLTRSYVEAKQQANDAILKQLAQRGVGVNTAELLMTYVALAVERLFGDMDDQRRLELENAYADVARTRLESTMTAVDRAMLTHGITPSGLHLPNGGPS
jgi:hypothetical protein